MGFVVKHVVESAERLEEAHTACEQVPVGGEIVVGVDVGRLGDFDTVQRVVANGLNPGAEQVEEQVHERRHGNVVGADTPVVAFEHLDFDLRFEQVRAFIEFGVPLLICSVGQGAAGFVEEHIQGAAVCPVQFAQLVEDDGGIERADARKVERKSPGFGHALYVADAEPRYGFFAPPAMVEAPQGFRHSLVELFGLVGRY